MKINLIVVRDPDGGVDIQVFADGTAVVGHGEVVIDTGSGWNWEDWKAFRDGEIKAARKISPHYLAAVRDAFDSPPGGRDYIGGKPDDEGWLPE